MKPPDSVDTIAAISSPPGTALRSIVRLSGPQSWSFTCRVLGGDAPEKPTGPYAFRADWPLLSQSYLITCQVQFWPEGRSYTGQELVEWHLSAPNVMAQKLLDELIGMGARAAEPGEFSFRAFMSGRIDLTQAEAVAGIFQATAPAQLELALEQLAGGLAKRVNRLRDRLLDLLAWLEATLDFVEESDVSPITRNLVGEELRGSAWELTQLAGQWSGRAGGEALRRVLLVGRPNAGKSTLFNALAGEARALVSPVPGTTRDYLESKMELAPGQEILLIDSAGLGDARDEFDARSQRLGKREQSLADLILLCKPVGEVPHEGPEAELNLPDDIPQIRVHTKADLAGSAENQVTGQGPPEHPEPAIKLSVAENRGLDDLKQAILQHFDISGESGPAVLETTRARTRDALKSAAEALNHAAATVAADGGDELVAMDLRTAVEALDIVTGRDVTEETLDRVFSRFCIGK